MTAGQRALQKQIVSGINSNVYKARRKSRGGSALVSEQSLASDIHSSLVTDEDRDVLDYGEDDDLMEIATHDDVLMKLQQLKQDIGSLSKAKLEMKKLIDR